MKALAALMVTGMFVAMAQAEPELKGTPTELADYLKDVPKTVFITGEAEVKVQADLAYVNLKVSTEARSLQEALSKNAELRQKISDELKKKGIPEQNIAGGKFASRPEFGMFSDKAKSYKIDNTIKVIVADESQFRLVAASIDAYSDVAYDGVTFEDSKESDTKKEALAKSCDVTTAKKKLYEEKFDITLKPVTFSEGQVYKQAPMPMAAAARGYQGVANAKVSYEGSDSDGGEVSQFGEITYRAVVTVQYQLQAK